MTGGKYYPHFILSLVAKQALFECFFEVTTTMRRTLDLIYSSKFLGCCEVVWIEIKMYNTINFSFAPQEIANIDRNDLLGH